MLGSMTVQAKVGTVSNRGGFFFESKFTLTLTL